MRGRAHTPPHNKRGTSRAYFLARLLYSGLGPHGRREKAIYNAVFLFPSAENRKTALYTKNILINHGRRVDPEAVAKVVCRL